MQFSPELGGFVPRRTRFLEIAESIYVAGDSSGIEEATTAMLEGQITGVHAALKLDRALPNDEALLALCIGQLDSARAGPFGEKIRRGLKNVQTEEIIVGAK